MLVLIGKPFIIGFAPSAFCVEQRLARGERGELSKGRVHVGDYGIDIFRSRAGNGRGARGAAGAHVAMKSNCIGKGSARISVDLRLEIQRQALRHLVEQDVGTDR